MVESAQSVRTDCASIDGQTWLKLVGETEHSFSQSSEHDYTHIQRMNWKRKIDQSINQIIYIPSFSNLLLSQFVDLKKIKAGQMRSLSSSKIISFLIIFPFHQFFFYMFILPNFIKGISKLKTWLKTSNYLLKLCSFSS